MAAELDLTGHEEEVLQDTLEAYGYDSPTEFVRQILRMHRFDERIEKLESFSRPNGVKRPADEA